jgi:curved DNA-binding protein CbpA
VGVSSPFEVLGIEPDADEDELKEAYRQRVLETHPDHGGSAEAFRQVREAYEAVKSGEARETPTGPTDDGATPPEEGSDEEPSGPEPTRVEYLNYDVIEERGWQLDDEGLFEKAADAGLDPGDYGEFLSDPEEPLLRSAEERGFTWPYACRGGACANCAVAVLEGELSMPVDHILPEEMLDRDMRLSCVGSPTTPELKVVYNLKHLPDLDDLRLPPHPFEQANRGD